YCGNSAAIWRCPVDPSTGINNKGQRVPRIRSMSMNGSVGGPGVEPRPSTVFDGFGWRVCRKLSDFIDPGPTHTFVLLDERADSLNDGHFDLYMRGYPQQPGQWAMLNWPASYHNKAGGLSFADGHSEIKRWLDSRTT